MRDLGRRAGIPAAEIVRRAIEAYDPERSTPPAEKGQARAMAMLDEIHASLRETIARIDKGLSVLSARMRSLEDGSLRDEVRKETLEWLQRNPDAARRLQEFFAHGAHPEGRT